MATRLQVGIDLGTSRTRMWTNHEGTIVDEATALAVDVRDGRVIAVGDEALAMKGRVKAPLQVLFPVKNGEIQDQKQIRAFLRVLMQKAYRSGGLWRPTIMVSVPAGLLPAVKEVLVEVVDQIGAREVYTMSQPLAAAIGAGVPIADASGTFLLHLGAGVAEAAIISLGSTVLYRSSPLAGAYFDTLVQKVLGETHALVVSEAEAERVKKKLVTVGLELAEGEAEPQLMIIGQERATASPQERMVTAGIFSAEAKNLMTQYERLLQDVLAHVPPELTVDILDKGILLSGGFAQLRGLDTYLVKNLGVPAVVVEETETVVVKGLATTLEHLEEFKKSLGYL